MAHNKKTNSFKKQKDQNYKSRKKLFINNLFKMGYSKRFSRDMSKDKHLNNITKAFQRRYRQNLVDSKIDQECFLISQNLMKKLH